MKITARAALLAAMGLALAGLQATPVTAGEGEGRVLACADFTGGSLFYKTDQSPTSATVGQGIVTTKSDFAAPTCADSVYTIYVLDASGTRLLSSSAQNGDGSQQLTHRLVLANDPLLPPQEVCVYGESTGKKGRAGDRAPDTGCVKLILDDPNSPGQIWK